MRRCYGPEVVFVWFAALVAAAPAICAGNTSVAPITVTKTSNPAGHAVQIKLPGYFALELGSADSYLLPNASSNQNYDGLDGFWDLKNDPEMRYNLAAQNKGLMEYQWGLVNRDGTPRVAEYKEGPGTVTVVESNNVRVRLKYSYRDRPYGNAASEADCCVTTDEYFSVYRPDKVYQTIKFSNTGADGRSPLTFNLFDVILKVTWTHVSNEPSTLEDKAEFERKLVPTCGYQARTPSPWLYVYQNPESDYRDKTYLLYSASGSSGYPPSGSPAPPCAGPPTPGDISVCANLGCVPPKIIAHVPVRSNFLEVIGESVGNYIASPFQYFLGARSRLTQGNIGSLPAGTDVVVRHTVLFAGDNGVNTKAAAEEYAAEYRTPPTLKMTTGSSQGFNKEMGDYELTSANNGVDFVARGRLHNPAFCISPWRDGAAISVLLGGTVLSSDRDYVAAMDQGRLLIQLLHFIPAGNRIQISTSNR
jgi:hypothetical protein